MMDLFMTLYGTFKWDDVSAKTVARARAQRLSGRLHSLTIERQMIPSLQKTDKLLSRNCYDLCKWSGKEHNALALDM